MESEERRIERLIHERDTLRLQLAKIEIERMKRQVQSLQEAPADSTGEDDIRAQVLDLVGSGRSVRQIAAKLHLSRSKVGRIKKKWDTRGTVAGQQ
jgi:DNA-binding NarL/FixJ family response regulator